jgi:type VI secretion system protein ImpA
VAKRLGDRGYAAEGASAAAGSALQPASSSAPGPSVQGGIHSKEDVSRALDQIAEYFERHEPSSPVPLLVRRARRLVGMSFVDIIRDLSPDAISQVNVVSGEKPQEG